MSVTIKDIARVLGISHITVSRALNNSNLVKPELKEKILQTAKELNYMPNVNAKNLVLDRSHNIGLFFSTLREGTSAEFFQQAVVGVNSIISGRYNLVIKAIDEYSDYRTINKRTFDGILVMSQKESDDCFVNHVMDKEIPTVVMNRKVSGTEMATVVLNDYNGAYEATSYLIQMGHRKIAIIEGCIDFQSARVRKQGFLQAVSDAGIFINKQYMLPGDYGFESGYNGMLKILQFSNRPTAVFCFNDNMALGAIRAAAENGINIPQDMSIVGFDDSIFARFITPELTTVSRPIRKMSCQGAKLMLDIIENNKSDKPTIYIDTQLKARNSVCNIAQFKV